MGKADGGWDALSGNSTKEIREVLRGLKKAGGWSLSFPEGHWGAVRCAGDGDGRRCRLTVPGTPKRPSTAARRIWEAAKKCDHGHAPPGPSPRKPIG